MGKDREGTAAQASSERRQRKSRLEATPLALGGNFERAFADALNDILVHERRRWGAA